MPGLYSNVGRQVLRFENWLLWVKDKKQKQLAKQEFDSFFTSVEKPGALLRPQSGWYHTAWIISTNNLDQLEINVLKLLSSLPRVWVIFPPCLCSLTGSSCMS
jgi:hypothetical protein